MSKMDDATLNSIKILALDMINKAGSGHQSPSVHLPYWQ